MLSILAINVYFAVSVPCSLVVTCLERADLLAILYVMLTCVFANFPYGVLDQVCYLIVLIPDLCLLSYLDTYSVDEHVCGRL